MNQQFYRVVYCSRNLIEGADPEQHAEITKILQAARTNNSRHNVTGALLYNSGYFAQVLEGPRASVEHIFEKIQRDARHSDVTVLEGGESANRDFPDWSMAHIAPAAPVVPFDSAESADSASLAMAADIGQTLHQAMHDPEAAGHDVLMLMRSLVVQES